MKILYITIGIWNEGISNTLIQRLNYLCEHTDFKLHIVSEYGYQKAMLDKLNPKVETHQLNLNSHLSKKRLPFFGYFSIKRDIKKEYQVFIDQLNPDIITTFDLESHYREIIPFIKTEAMKIIEIRGSNLGSREAGRYKRQQNIEKRKKAKLHPLQYFRISNIKLHNSYDAAIVLTKEDKADRTYLKLPVFQFYNSFQITESPTNFKKRENNIIGVGRLGVDKNFRDLILAVSKIKDELKDWKVQIYGEGDQRNNLEKLIKNENLEDTVVLKGNVLNMSEVYNNSKLLVSTSLSEGFGRTILEALIYKIPVIAYNCKCGPKEIINEGVNGYLIDFSAEQLAEKILELTSDSEKLEFFSSHCHNEIDRFDFNKIMNEWIEFYQNIVK